jgi:uncharacterized protein with HEPN domain
MSRDWRLFINDILQSCEKVRRYTIGMTQAQFLADDRTYDAVLRNLEIIGEAAKRLPIDVRQNMPQIEWAKIAGMRDWLAHAYFGLDADIIWDVVESKLPELEQAVQGFNDS